MKNNTFFALLLMLILSSCIGTKDIKYLQANENLEINSEGLVSYNIPTYRVTRNDILTLNIVTTPKGDAAQFYSAYNTSSGRNSNVNHNTGGNISGGNISGGNGNFYFNGLKVDSKGDIYVFGIGFVKAEGRTLEDISNEIQTKVNKNFVEGKSEVRLNIDGIRYYVLGDIESVGITGEKVVYKNTLSITEALALNGGLNRTVDRKNIRLHRKFPEGIKIVTLDLTREDIMNSPYYWVQNGDEFYLNTRSRNLHGFGKEPLQTLTTGVSVVTTALSIYLLLTRTFK
ncbi:MAG: polysaccharide biosynthesis/export family protein [Flavobacteriaceae bacterium]|nr:polysaccharide biosynthesis/export family protein [Flavobacteriaceae bacterium]